MEEATRTLAGLNEADAARRRATRGPVEPEPSSRSYRTIVRANVLTVFNLILLVFGLLTLAAGYWRDALFLVILIINTAIGIAQEVRSKYALDRLAALVTPVARVVRDGRERPVRVEELVAGDLVRIGPGDQVVADGRLVTGGVVGLDESILTGEARSVRRVAPEAVRSGSFCVDGAGAYAVEAVGRDSYAQRVAGEAREFRHPRSPLERSINRLLFVLVGLMVPLAVIFCWALARQDISVRTAVRESTAAVVTLIPEGLILLVSLTYAVAALRLARAGALTQQLSAIEALASAEVICIDKTGTLTAPTLQMVGRHPAPGVDDARLAAALGRYAASSPNPNATLRAIGDANTGLAETPTAEVPFSSGRRWSALRLGATTYVLGAPERFDLGELVGPAGAEAAGGRRVLAFGASEEPVDPDDPALPGGLQLLGLVMLAESLRANIRETVAYLTAQGVRLCVLSGDAPPTVAAIARDVGIDPGPGALDGDHLPADPGELRDLLVDGGVVGRVSPDGKRRVVEALAEGGTFVAMVGDGVNDVPALKAARLGIAQGSGSQMARAVADLVLVRDDFAAVPAMVEEGRKILRNLQRVTKLFVTKSTLAAFLILTVGLTPTSYPFLPRHLTVASAITIGIPAFFLALAPSSGPWRTDGFLREVGRFALPAGVAAGLGVLASYLFALNVAGMSLADARTVATTVLILVGLYLIVVLEAQGYRRSAWVLALVAGLLALYGLILASSAMRSFFALSAPGPAIVSISIVGAGIAAAGLWIVDERFVPFRSGEPGPTADGTPSVR
jgi:cation-transporting ATPase E